MRNERYTRFPQRDEPCNLAEGKFSPGSNFTGNFYRCPITNKTPPRCQVNKFVCSEFDVLHSTHSDVRITMSCEPNGWYEKAAAAAGHLKHSQTFDIPGSKQCSSRTDIF